MQIATKDVIVVEQSKADLVQSPHPFVFIIALTATKHYHVQCASAADRIEWMQHLRKTCESNTSLSLTFCPGLKKGTVYCRWQGCCYRWHR